MPNTHSKPTSKAEVVFSEVFGPALPGFGGDGLPSALDIVAYFQWLLHFKRDLYQEDSDGKGVKLNKEDYTDIYWTITNCLMVHWRMSQPDVVMKTKQAITEQIRKLMVEKALKVKKMTFLLGKQEKIEEQRSNFQYFFDVERKTCKKLQSIEVSQLIVTFVTNIIYFQLSEPRCRNAGFA